MLGKDEINKRFSVPTEVDANLSAVVRQNFKWFAAMLDKSLPDGRAKSVAMTYLEDCYLWSGHAMNEIVPVSYPDGSKTDRQKVQEDVDRAVSAGDAALRRELSKGSSYDLVQVENTEDLPAKG